MNGARLIKRKEAEKRAQHDHEDGARMEACPPAIDTVVTWRTKWQAARRPNAREAFAALFANPSFSESTE